MFKKEFSKIFETWSFISAIFIQNISRKYHEIFKTFSKSKKITIFVPKSVQNHYIDENLAKFSHKTPKNSQIFLKNLIFPNFRRLGAPKIWILCPENPFFGIKPPPPWARVPLIYLWFISFYLKLKNLT